MLSRNANSRCHYPPPKSDGLGLIQEAATRGELSGLSEGADVLLFALA